MKTKILINLALAAVLFLGLLLPAAECGSVRMRVVVLNPSTKLTQVKDVRATFPKEVTLKDIKDDGGLEIEFDSKEGAFVASRNGIELAPGESKSFEILLDDVWMVDEKKIDVMRKRTESLVKGMKNTKAYERAALVSEGMYARMDQIVKTQNNPNVTTNQHIAYYRDNVKLLEALEKDLDELEKLLVTAGGTVSLAAVENADVDVKGPNVKTTWVIIFVILIFIAILGAVFYFTWQGQAGTKEKDPDAASSPFEEHKPDE